MAEKVPLKPPESQQPPEYIEHQLAGIKVIEGTRGARLSWDKDKKTLTINTTLFPSLEVARYTALQQIGSQLGLANAFASAPNVLLEQSKIHTDSIFYQGYIISKIFLYPSFLSYC